MSEAQDNNVPRCSNLADAHGLAAHDFAIIAENVSFQNHF
jgi:hypothetical protein